MNEVDLRFSERFGAPDDEEWFDRLPPSDTKLFVDPFRVYAEKQGFWVGAHDERA